MTAPRSAEQPAAATRGWTPLPGQAHDRCWRCGRPTPVGVSLCDDDNPGRIGSPSSTQVHGTIFVGVVAGFVLLALAARLGLGTAGPFPSSIESTVSRADGGFDVAVRVTNQGAGEAAATCRISRGGVARRDDTIFMTERIPAGQTRVFSRSIPRPGPDDPPLVAGRLAVACR